MMPFKSEHSARQLEPSMFDGFKRVHEEPVPDGIDFIYGIKPDGSSQIQSVRADAEKWTVEDFRAWLIEHELTDEHLEPAAEEAEADELAEPGSTEDDEDQSVKAKPDERIKGSEKNEPGSASGDRGGIEVSEQVESTLKDKIEEHNEDVGDDKSKRADLGMLKAVYRRGAGAFSSSHRPGMTRGQWAMARVNHFLHLLKTGKPKDPKYITDNDLLPKEHPRSTKED